MGAALKVVAGAAFPAAALRRLRLVKHRKCQLVEPQDSETVPLAADRAWSCHGREAQGDVGPQVRFTSQTTAGPSLRVLTAAGASTGGTAHGRY